MICAKAVFGRAPVNMGVRNICPPNGPPETVKSTVLEGAFRFVSTKFGSELPKLNRYEAETTVFLAIWRSKTRSAW